MTIKIFKYFALKFLSDFCHGHILGHIINNSIGFNELS